MILVLLSKLQSQCAARGRRSLRSNRTSYTAVNLNMASALDRHSSESERDDRSSSHLAQKAAVADARILTLDWMILARSINLPVPRVSAPTGIRKRHLVIRRCALCAR